MYALKAAVERNLASGKERREKGTGARRKETGYAVRDDSLACKRQLKPNQPGNCTSLRLFRYISSNIPWGRSCACFIRNVSRVILFSRYSLNIRANYVSVDIFIRKFLQWIL